MYKILTDGLLHPRQLLAYRNKSGWFVLAFFAFLSLFATIGQGLFYVSYGQNSDFRPENTACEYLGGTLVCDEPGHDYTEPLDFFGSDAYFLPSGVDVSSLGLSAGTALVFQDEYVAFFSEGDGLMSIDLSPVLSAGTDLASIMSTYAAVFLVMTIFFAFLGNILLLAVFTLMSAMPLVRLRGFLRFKKAYTVLAFSSVPFALVLTFNNILRLPEWAFMILMFISFRSSFVVIRELFEQAFAYLNPEAASGPDESARPEEDEPRDDETPAPKKPAADEDDNDDDRS